MYQNQDKTPIEVFCLGFKDGKDEGFILCLDKDRLKEDIFKIPKRFPGAIVSQKKPYSVWASPQTYKRICDNGGRLVQLKQKPPKRGKTC